jgi:ferredoxin
VKRLLVGADPKEVECQTNSPVGLGLLSSGLNIPMLCGGKGLCATCHVHVVEGAENLSPIEPREERALNLLSGRAPNSRLSCQARILGDVRVKLPDADYVSHVEELEARVGTRAERDILHGVDGRLLVRKGQLITRYVLNQMRLKKG